ncbi:hypothetical protein C8R47DRAFT_1161658 [Mycena vitilis]|nr:hypothetical protein C8R47DRAFT_1161658 [Mycena vitilis]
MSLSSISETIPVKLDHPFSKKLHRLSTVLSTAFPLRQNREATEDWCIDIDGEEAGTMWEPDVDLILSKSIPSSFGKGEATVLDPEYRNGREIVADNIDLGTFPEDKIIEEVAKTLFPGNSRTVSLSLYKLAMYEKGGHFDWNRDTTHSDDHHATVLVALDTPWTGGDLKLRHEDVTVCPDMHPSDGALAVVAFYTDIEHMVEPVTEGVRIILQFDVHVLEEVEEEPHENKEHRDETYWDDDPHAIAVEAHCHKSAEIPTSSIPCSSTANDAAMHVIIHAIKELHGGGLYEVGFPLQHLYRKASVLPTYLKCTDARLYEALKRTFDVSIHPVIIEETTDDEGHFTGEAICAYKLDLPESDTESESDSDKPKKKQKLRKIFYLPKTSPLIRISSRDYSDYTGNEPQFGENNYLGAGFFVRAKKVVNSVSAEVLAEEEKSVQGIHGEEKDEDTNELCAEVGAKRRRGV